jgi:hypothetical protein
MSERVEDTKPKCTHCGSTNLLDDEDVGEIVCRDCGTVSRETPVPANGFENGAGRGTTVPHLPDKNLPTTFNPREVKDTAQFENMRRLERLNKTAPQRSGAGTRYRIQKRLRPILEKMPILTASRDRRQRDAIGEALDFASNLVTKKKPPQDKFLYEALALLSTIHSDPMRLLLRSLSIESGFDALVGSVAGASEERNDKVVLKHASPGRWTAKHKFENGLIAGDVLNVTVNFTYKSQHFTLSTPIELCLNFVGRPKPNMTFRRLGKKEGGVHLWVSKSKIRRGELFKIDLQFQPPILQTGQLSEPEIFIESGKKKQLIAKTYQRLCVHFGLRPFPISPERLVENDKTLTSIEKQACMSMIKTVTKRTEKIPGFQDIKPNYLAAMCVAYSTKQSQKNVAERYGLKVTVFESNLKRIDRLGVVGGS